MLTKKQKKLLAESRKVKKQATQLLRQSKLVSILKNYGLVKIAGSYEMDVMLRPDLDFFIVAKKHNYKKFSAIFSKLVSSKYFYEAAFANWVDFGMIPPFELQKGYYARVHRIIAGTKWKVDLWFITPEYDWSAKYTDKFKVLMRTNRNQKRGAILQIKEDLYIRGKKYAPGVDGKLIYQAVLEHGIMTTAAFKRWLGKQ